MRAAIQTLLIGGCLVLGGPVVTLADEILSVDFPQGYRQACSAPAMGHFTAQGPGPITVRVVIAPYKSLGWHPNIPIYWRSSWWTNKGDFASEQPLPNLVSTRYTQGGKETGDWVDGIPLVVERTYELETAEAYAVDVKGTPQCWPVSNRDYDYWQDGQQVLGSHTLDVQ